MCDLGRTASPYTRQELWICFIDFKMSLRSAHYTTGFCSFWKVLCTFIFLSDRQIDNFHCWTFNCKKKICLLSSLLPHGFAKFIKKAFPKVEMKKKMEKIGWFASTEFRCEPFLNICTRFTFTYIHPAPTPTFQAVFYPTLKRPRCSLMVFSSVHGV